MARNILLVEDDPRNRRNLVTFLRAQGYVIEPFDNGPAAIERIKASRFDAVIADFQLGGQIDGLAVLAQFERASPGKGKILISGTVGLEPRCDSLGALFIPKPVQLADLLVKLQSMLPKPAAPHQPLAERIMQAKMRRALRERAAELRRRSAQLNQAYDQSRAKYLALIDRTHEAQGRWKSLWPGIGPT